MDDIEAAVNYLHQEKTVRRYKIDTNRFILGGKSFGGGVALAYAAQHSDIERILTIAPDDYGALVREYRSDATYAKRIDTMLSDLEFPQGPIRYDGVALMNELLQNPEPYDLRQIATALSDRDILLIGGWDDVNVPIEHRILPFYRSLMAEGADSVKFVAFQDDHSFGKSIEAMGELIVDWITLQ
jgi:pimeloyl-ACP methyl ester carboxylesterase